MKPFAAVYTDLLITQRPAALIKMNNKNPMVQQPAAPFSNKAMENNWNRTVSQYQIETDLYQRQHKTKKSYNFHLTLPKQQADLANGFTDCSGISCLDKVRARKFVVNCIN